MAPFEQSQGGFYTVGYGQPGLNQNSMAATTHNMNQPEAYQSNYNNMAPFEQSQGGFYPVAYGQPVVSQNYMPAPNNNQPEGNYSTSQLNSTGNDVFLSEAPDVEMTPVDPSITGFAYGTNFQQNISQANNGDVEFTDAPQVGSNPANFFSMGGTHNAQTSFAQNEMFNNNYMSANHRSSDQDSDLDDLQSLFDLPLAAEAPKVKNPAALYTHEGKSVEEMIGESNDGIYMGYIRSHEHAQQLEAEYLAMTDAKLQRKINPQSLADLPRTEEDRAKWRQRIFYAITNFDQVVNKDRKKGGKDNKGNPTDGITTNTHVRRIRNLSGFEAELIADKILRWATEAHQGRPGIAPWCEKRSWTMEQFESFDKRMQAVLQALRENKSVPHSYIQVDPTQRFVLGPQKELKTKQGNMVLNAEKGGLIDMGRQARRK